MGPPTLDASFFRHLLNVARRHATQFSVEEINELEALADQMEDSEPTFVADLAYWLFSASRVAVQAAEAHVLASQGK